MVAFCCQESLSDKTFYKWQRNLLTEERNQPSSRRFSEFVIDLEAEPSPRVKVIFDDGTRLVVSDIASDDQLLRVLSELRVSA